MSRLTQRERRGDSQTYRLRKEKDDKTIVGQVENVIF